MFDRTLKERATRTIEVLETLQAAFTGEPFEYRGRTVQVTPAPQTPGGPPLLLGGTTTPAARRAAKFGVGFLPAGAEVWEDYRSACLEFERPDPGPWLGGDTSFIHVAEDVEKGWEQIGAHAMHEANSYGKWMADAGIGAGRRLHAVREPRRAAGDRPIPGAHPAAAGRRAEGRRPVRQCHTASDDGRHPAAGCVGEPAPHRRAGHPERHRDPSTRKGRHAGTASIRRRQPLLRGDGRVHASHRARVHQAHHAVGRPWTERPGCWSAERSTASWPTRPSTPCRRPAASRTTSAARTSPAPV